jgi:hypothetical protein
MLALSLAYFLIVALVRERTDEDLSEDVGEFADLLREGGLGRVEQEIRLDMQGDEVEDEFIRLSARDGTLVAATDLDAFSGLPAPPASLLTSAVGADPVLATLRLSGRDHAVRTASGAISADYRARGRSIARGRRRVRGGSVEPVRSAGSRGRRAGDADRVVPGAPCAAPRAGGDAHRNRDRGRRDGPPRPR